MHINEKTFQSHVENDKGFVLIAALLFLLILSVLGISTINTATTEIIIAGHHKVTKQTFAEADGGTEVGGALLEENIACPTGFDGPPPLQIGATEITADEFSAGEANLNFWANEDEPAVEYPSDTRRYIRLPANDNVPHTNLFFYGNSSLSTGNAIQMLASYEGRGYAAAAGGGQLVTNIDSQHRGQANSASTIRINWRHIIGQEGTCKY